MPLRVFIVTGTAYGAAAATACSRISPSSLRFHGSAPPAALAGHLGHRAAEVEVDVRDAVLRAQDLGGLADVDRVGAVELHRAHGLELVEDEHVEGVLVPLDHAAAGDHLADVEAGALLGAQPAVRRVGDPRHRREHHGRRHLQRAEGETGHAPIVGRVDRFAPITGTRPTWPGRLSGSPDSPVIRVQSPPTSAPEQRPALAGPQHRHDAVGALPDQRSLEGEVPLPVRDQRAVRHPADLHVVGVAAEPRDVRAIGRDRRAGRSRPRAGTRPAPPARRARSVRRSLCRGPT